MKRFFLLLVLCFAFCGANAHAAPDDTQQKQEELDALRARIQRVQQQLARDIGRRDELTTELRATERELGNATVALRDVNVTLQSRQERLGELEAERHDRNAALAAERDALAGQVRAAYMAGREEKMKLLLNQQDPATLGRMLVYYDYLNRARAARIARVHEQLVRLEALGREIAAEVMALDAARAERETLLAALEKTRDQRAALLVRLEGDIRDRNTELRRLQTDERALAELVASLLDVFADIPDLANRVAFSTLRGKLAWPSRGEVLADFGAPRADGRMRWNGMMIAASPGTPVRAVSHGRVAFADWLPHYGLLLVIEHGDGYLSLYGHNQALYKEAGDWVEAGEIVAAMGDSGGQQRAALYFEIRHGKRIENPRRWLELKT